MKYSKSTAANWHRPTELGEAILAASRKQLAGLDTADYFGPR
jgi:hypothetical protein